MPRESKDREGLPTLDEQLAEAQANIANATSLKEVHTNFSRVVNLAAGMGDTLRMCNTVIVTGSAALEVLDTLKLNSTTENVRIGIDTSVGQAKMMLNQLTHQSPSHQRLPRAGTARQRNS